jgi:hypothetical protein
MMGRIKHRGRMTRPNDMQVMAQQVADAVRPSFAGDHFYQMRTREFNRYGNFGLAHDPDQLKQKLSVNSMATSFTPTIHEMIQKQMQGMAAPKGPAQAAQLPTGTHTATSSDGDSILMLNGPQNANPNINVGDETTSTSGPGSLGAASDPYVHDQGWGTTLSGLLASKAFTAAQLQAASIQNVSKLIKWIGGGGSTELQHQQVEFMMQRYVLEGFMNGVDVPRLIQAQYNGSGVPIGFFADQGSTIGWGGGGQVTWSMSYWNGTDSAGQLADFYHEMGHELLGEQHEANGIMHYIVESPSAIKANEAQLLADYFRTHATRGELGNGVTLAQFYGTPDHAGGGVDPTPYLSGFPMSGPYNPSAPGPGGPVDPNAPNIPNNNTTNNTTVVPPSIVPQGLGGNSGGKNGPDPSKPSDEKTLVAGSLGPEGGNGFAAGIQQLASG